MSETVQTVPCSLCEKPTRMLGSKLCDRCWELQTRIAADPDLARRALFLHDRAAPVRKIRTLTVVIREANDFSIYEGEGIVDRLCWDEFLGTIAVLTHPTLSRLTGAPIPPYARMVPIDHFVDEMERRFRRATQREACAAGVSP